ncbi:MAG: Glu/Leu/Phe/Val dehydrogenase family protein, partial [Solirubrobacterales bacterium]
GKGVICARPGGPPAGDERRQILLDFADTVNVLVGTYITAEDVGTSSEDMIVIRQGTEHVAGLPESHGGSGDPSPVTALGVEAAIRACCDRVFGSRDLSGRSAAVVGVGRVGSRLAELLTRAGASVFVADIDESKRSFAEQLGARWCDPNVALQAEVDVLAPCALGGVINESNVERLRCAVVCGSANNQLAHEGLAEDLHARDILYAPDFVANAGGLINIAVEREGYDRERALQRVGGIEDTMDQLLDEAEAAQGTPLAAAYRLARRRLEDSTHRPDAVPA